MIAENSSYYYNNKDIDDSVLVVHANEVADEDVAKQSQDEDEDGDRIQMEAENYAGALLTNSRPKTNIVEKFRPANLCDDEDFKRIFRCLNIKQRMIVIHVLHCLKTERLPFYIFLSRGAEVGKSHVITAIIQGYMRFCSKFQTIHPSEICIMVSAPTGKPSHNVFGITLHSTFNLPANQYAGEL